jgi:hypothetical protein
MYIYIYIWKKQAWIEAKHKKQKQHEVISGVAIMSLYLDLKL